MGAKNVSLGGARLQVSDENIHRLQFFRVRSRIREFEDVEVLETIHSETISWTRTQRPHVYQHRQK